MTILFTFAVAYTWLAYLRDWDAYKRRMYPPYPTRRSQIIATLYTLVHKFLTQPENEYEDRHKRIQGVCTSRVN